MNQRLRSTSVKRGLYGRSGRDGIITRTSAINYYLLALFISAAVFFFTWVLLHDGYDETPLIVAAIAAVSFAAGFVLFREVMMRRSRERAQAARRLSHHLDAARRLTPPRMATLTVERNEALLHEIRTKSEAAKVLGKFADAHKEVFELCDDYLSLASAELAEARAGSPRIPAIRKGTVSAAKRHRFHMLKWAELKAKAFTSEASQAGGLEESIEAAEAALDAVDRAYAAYPEDRAVVDSRRLLHAFLATASLRNSIGLAEQAEAEGSNMKAVEHYNDALASLSRFEHEISEADPIASRIRSEIARLSKLMDPSA